MLKLKVLIGALETGVKKVSYILVLTFVCGLVAAESQAASLPNGTCSAGHARVKVSGGKIRSYSWKGQGYAVGRKSATAYSIGPAG